MIHGHISVNNIILTPSEAPSGKYQVRLIDFNLKASWKKSPAEGDSFSKSDIFGKAVTPEEFDKERIRDISYVGVVLFRMLTKRVPQKTMTAEEKRALLKTYGIRDNTIKVICTAMEGGYRSASEMLRDIRSLSRNAPARRGFTAGNSRRRFAH